MKDEADEKKIVKAIYIVSKGNIYLSETMNSEMIDRCLHRKKSIDSLSEADCPLRDLTDRELEVFRFIGEGLSTRHISERMFLSINTIGTYKNKIKEKLRLKTSTELVRYAFEYFKRL